MKKVERHLKSEAVQPTDQKNKKQLGNFMFKLKIVFWISGINRIVIA